jgi:hypothetical protein
MLVPVPRTFTPAAWVIACVLVSCGSRTGLDSSGGSSTNGRAGAPGGGASGGGTGGRIDGGAGGGANDAPGPDGATSGPCTAVCNGTCSAGACFETLATGVPVGQGYSGMAVDDTNVYWDEGGQTSPPGPPDQAGAVLAVSKQGGTATTLVTRSGLPLTDLTIDASSVDWLESGSSNGTLMQVAKGGGTASTVVSGLRYAYALAGDGKALCWTEGGNNGADRLASVPTSGGTPATLASHLNNPGGLAVDAT